MQFSIIPIYCEKIFFHGLMVMGQIIHLLITNYIIRPIKKETLNSVQKFEVSKPK